MSGWTGCRLRSTGTDDAGRDLCRVERAPAAERLADLREAGVELGDLGLAPLGRLVRMQLQSHCGLAREASERIGRLKPMYRHAMELRRIQGLPPYVFAQIDQLKLQARRAGVDVIDLGFGNPDIPSPDVAVEKLAEAVHNPRNHRYSASRGIPKLRQAICGPLPEAVRRASWTPIARW